MFKYLRSHKGDRVGKIYIYGLANPETGVVRYVGKTNSPHRRKNEHHIDGANHKSCWLDFLHAKGLEPEMKILEVVEDGTDWRERELYWLREILENGGMVVNGWGDINAATGTYCRDCYLWGGARAGLDFLDGSWPIAAREQRAGEEE